MDLLTEFIKLYATVDPEAFDDNLVHVSFDIKTTDDLQFMANLSGKVTWDPKDEEASERLSPGEYEVGEWAGEMMSFDKPIDDVSDVASDAAGVEELFKDDTEEPWRARALINEINTLSAYRRFKAWAFMRDDNGGILAIRATDFKPPIDFYRMTPLIYSRQWKFERIRDEVPQHISRPLTKKLGG